MYQNFTFYNPVRVLFGAGQLSHLHEQTLPGKKALIVTSNGSSVKKYGYLASLEAELDKAGVFHALFDQIRPNPTDINVTDGATAVKANGCDFVIALGGGSVMDCAKCIALMAANPGNIWDYSLSARGGKKNALYPAIPIVCITTSAGTASEVDIASVITNDRTQEKTGIFFPSMFPTLSIVDSDLMMSVPPRLTAYQGMDAFFHASETVVNKNVHPMAEMFALKTIELVARYLPRAVKDGSDKEARAYMALANTFAGYYMMCTSAHTMEHVMGSFHDDLVHGAGLIEIAHAYYDFFAERKAAEEPMKKMARAMGVENPASGKDFIAALDKLISDVGCADLAMSREGITREELKSYPAKVHEVLGGDITADPLPLSDADYLAIFEAAYK
nr:iron-containing alcohol dehydrogenase [Treponema sp.]